MRRKRGGGNSCTMELLKRIQDTAGLGADSSIHWGIGAAYYHRFAQTFRLLFWALNAEKRGGFVKIMLGCDLHL